MFPRNFAENRMNTMESFGWARIAIYYAQDDPYAPYYREVLEHAGLRAEALEGLSAGDLSHNDVVLLAGKGTLNPTQASALEDWVHNGGSLVCSGSTWGLHSILGFSGASTWISNSLIEPQKEDRLWPEGVESIRFFGGAAVTSTSAHTVANSDGKTLVARKSHGRGVSIYVGAHVGQTMCLMQNGRSVECDGIGPGDGSAVLDDGKLRAEDGTTLDFTADRGFAGEHPYFNQPHSDLVKEIWIRAILEAAEHSGRFVPMLWHWPSQAAGSAVLSLDCEDFETDKVVALQRTLTMFGCRAAWIVGTPGYSTDVYRGLRAWEHEVGLLFHTDDGTGWHEEKLKIQVTSIGRLSGTPSIISVRPVDGKWRGWLNFYELCEATGARMSLSKGGRQPGTSGFLFGTCHPYFPMNREGRSFFTGELPYTVFMPGRVTPDPVSDAILESTVARHGCVHVVMTPESLSDPTVSASLRRLLSLCKQSRLEFMLPDQIYRYEKARRQMRIFQKHTPVEGTLQLVSEFEVENLSLMISGPRMAVQVKGKEIPGRQVTRYGTTFTAVSVDVQPKQQLDLHVKPMAVAAAA